MNNSIPEIERPSFFIKEVVLLLKEHYGLCCNLEELTGERDLNYLARTKNGESYVVKISNSSETREFMNVQNEALDRISRMTFKVSIPEICLNKNGEPLSTVISSDKKIHLMRLVRYIDGIPMSEYRPHTKEFLEELGRMCGVITKSLHKISSIPPKRKLLWEMHDVEKNISEFIPYIKEKKLRECVRKSIDFYSESLLPLEKKLRKGWIHNDFNNYNILVVPNLTGSHELGLIDFGDMTHSYLIADLAVACAYAMLDKSDFLGAAVHLTAGFHGSFALEECEIEILFPMVLARLCLSVTLGAFQQKKDPKNEYLGISQKPVRELLEKLQNINHRYVKYLFRDACKIEACPMESEFIKWQKKEACKFFGLLGKESLKKNSVVLDLGVGSSFSVITENMSLEEQQEYFSKYLKTKNALIGIGKYAESRSIYSSKQFLTNSIDGEERRTVHLGIDVFMTSGSLIYAPIEGEVLFLQDNNGALDYGPTVIMRHKPVDGPEFFSLYGHLGRGCLENLQIGQFIGCGEAFAKIGESNENGGWLPHVHFQVILDIFDYKGNYPGVALPSQQDVWTSICPDPSKILGISSEIKALQICPEKLLKRRKNVFSSSLSLSYEVPIAILRGKGQSLIDSKGQVYLDCINNVAHVGHSHPRVAEAQMVQANILNTNTRFLNPVNIDYAERLCDLFPDPLDTCFLVCSGSEANELALRIAFTVSERKEVIVIEEGYHGNTITNIDISPYKHNGPGGKGPPDWVHEVPMPYLYRGKYQDPADAGKLYALEVKKICEKLYLKGTPPAAFICESILGCGGHVPLPNGFLKQTYEYVRQYGGLCIADEVQVGFGRVGKHFWSFELQDVVPDIVTLGKPIGNGYPMGAVITSKDIAEKFANGMEYFNTFGGSQVSCSVGMAVLDILENEGLCQNAFETGSWLKQKLKEQKNSSRLIGDVRGEGFFLGIELVLDPETRDPAPHHAKYLVERLKSRNILLSVEGPGQNVLKFKPPMVFSHTDAERLLRCLGDVLGESPLKYNS